MVSRVCRQILPSSVGDLSEVERAQLVALAIRHEQIVEEIFHFSPVLPVRFGTVFHDTDTIGNLLATVAEPVQAFLDEARDREEWVVKGFLQTERVRRTVIAAEPDLAARIGTLSATPGVRYLQEKKLFADADRRTGVWTASAATRVTAQLAGDDIPVERLRLSGTSDPEFGGPPVFHAAFLIDRASRTEWLRRLDATAAQFGPEGLSLIGTGPWPPADFAPDLSQVLPS